MIGSDVHAHILAQLVGLAHRIVQVRSNTWLKSADDQILETAYM